jgi:hypothetical protein
VKLIPRGSRDHRVLSFCFVDPYSVDLRFETIRRLSERYIDFLILLALGMDANLNLPVYIEDHHTRIETFLDDPRWRTEWREQERRGGKFIPFLAQKYARAMTRLEPPSWRRRSPAYSSALDERRTPAVLPGVLRSSPAGYDFWGEVKVRRPAS